MFTITSSEVKLSNKKDIYVGSIADGGFFAVLEAEGVDAPDGDHFLKSLGYKIGQTTDHTLAEFESTISSHLVSQNMPAHASVACGLVHEDKIYLKTLGEGQVYLRRAGEFARLIDGGSSASGYIQSDDLMIFATPSFIHSLGSDGALAELVKLPHSTLELSSEISKSLVPDQEASHIGLFVSFERALDVYIPEQRHVEGEELETGQHQQDAPMQEDASGTPQNYWGGGQDSQQNVALEEQVARVESFDPSVQSSNTRSRPRLRLSFSLGPLREFFNEQVQKYGKRKAISLIAVTVIFIVFVLSVAFSGLVRTDSQNRKKIEATRQIVIEKLNSAEEVAFLNLPRATALFAEAKGEVEKLKRDVGDKKEYPEIAKLDALIAQKEGFVFKKEERRASEFYDLSVENKLAKGAKIALFEDTAAIVDSDQGTIYLLSLAKKSLDKRVSSKIKGSGLIAIDKDRVLFYKPGDGIFSIDESSKVKQVLDRDDKWGTISDMALFNRNLYLLDSTHDAIYKYGVTEDGYGGKVSYINAGQIADLAGASSIAIDGNVYVGGTDQIIQYLAGDKQEFNPVFPEKNVQITKIFSNSDTEKVWVWDRQGGLLYGVSKTGSYDFQIRSSQLKIASDFVALKDHAYILNGPKVYELSLN